jgi:hypothetical protein
LRVESFFPGEVGNFVLVKTGAFGVLDEFLIHVARQIFVHVKLARLHLGEERRVLLVDDFVAGQMFAAERERLGQGRLPNPQGLAGNREHQIEIQIVESGLSQNVEGFENHLARVDPAQAVEQFFIE